MRNDRPNPHISCTGQAKETTVGLFFSLTLAEEVILTTAAHLEHFVIKIGIRTVSWKSNKQQCVALSSTEAECMPLCQAAKELIWGGRFPQSLGLPFLDPIAANANN